MIPLRLQLSGFLSYYEPAELDFESFNLACISGSNGAGKSSLLDAITWALFGIARRKDDAVINSHAVKIKKPAHVMFEFLYENSRYRVDRSKLFDKTTMLEFQVQEPGGTWRVLTESSVRLTEQKIQQTLRMDFETFTNASFFLQGKADQFAVQRPPERKRILSSILGLEEWEDYRERAADRRKQRETELAAQDGLLNEVDAELAQEDERRARLKQVEDELKNHEALRKAGEINLENARRLEAYLAEQRRMVELFRKQWQDADQRLTELNSRIEKRLAGRAELVLQLASEPDVRRAYERWQADRQELQQFDELAQRFREIEAQRREPLQEIAAARAALVQEQSGLLEAKDLASEQESQLGRLAQELEQARREETETAEIYDRWAEIRRQLDVFEAQASQFHDLEARRKNPQTTLEREQAALQQEKTSLMAQQHQARGQEEQRTVYQAALQDARREIDTLNERLSGLGARQSALEQARELRAGLRLDNDRLNDDMKLIKERIDRLKQAAEGACPLCGQPLTPQHRQELVVSLGEEGRGKGDRFRSNLDQIKALDAEILNLEKETGALRSLEQTEFQAKNRRAAKLEESVHQLDDSLAAWQTGGELRLAEVARMLDSDEYALDARRELANLDRKVHELGYNALAHQEVRQAEQQARLSESRLQDLRSFIAGLSERARQLEQNLESWAAGGAMRLAELKRIIAGEDFAHPARRRLAEIDDRLRSLGYDPDAHESTRLAEVNGRQSEELLRGLEGARANLESLEREISSLEDQLAREKKTADEQQAVMQQAENKLAAAQVNQPDPDGLEQEVFDLKERESKLKMHVGAARQQVETLKNQKSRRLQIEVQRQRIREEIGRYKQLEKAFGKDGVPALLIEQALPEIEEQANEILDRLSAGQMSVRFATQKEYKDKNRDDKKETLDILIGDSAGIREYEMFSGGEAFRVNFAIRLALSRVLAQRAGARLQTLVIDEGFGSQDAEGRQRLVEAINLVRPEFAKVLVITHLEELKDAFPARIEVEKTPTGSRVRVL